MSFQLSLVPGWAFSTGDTVTATSLNALGRPSVTMDDGKTLVPGVGTVSLPGLAFNGDLDTGLAQLGGANTISFVVGGTEVARPTAQGIMFAVGSVSLPSVYFSGDANTGLYWISADKIGVTVGGTNVGSFSSTGLDAVGLSVSGLAVRTTGLSTSAASFSTDFLGASTSWGTTSTVVSTGTVTAVALGYGNSDTVGRGCIQQSVSAVADRAVVTCSFAGTVGAVARFRPGNLVLSTPSERYVAIWGLFNDLTVSSSAGQGAFFQYTDSASAQFQTVTYNGTNRETQTTSVTVAVSTFYLLEIRHTSTSVWEFYINGTLVSTHDDYTFSSTSGDFQYVGAALEKTVGSGARTMQLDSIEAQNTISRT